MGAVLPSRLALAGERAGLSCEQILASVADAGAGPSYSVQALAGALQRQGASVRIRSVQGWRATDEGPDRAAGVAYEAHRQDFARTPFLRALCASRDMARALDDAAAYTDIIHAHGLWLMPGLYASHASRKGRAKLVVSPRGMLGAAALDYSRLKKAALWRLAQKEALAGADCLHATSEAEFEAIRAAGLTNPVAVIPNGVDVPPLVREQSASRCLLSLGRIHPKKGLDRLVEAWARLHGRFPDWRLRIIGPAEGGHDRELLAQAKALGAERISIEGPAFGDAKAAAYASAELFVLPTRNENFAMTVAEALAAGLPAISTTGAPWEGLRTHGCGWWIEQGIEPLELTLAEAMAMTPAALSEMGLKGRAWMTEDFSWDAVGGQMLNLYAWLARDQAQPTFVRFG